MAKDRKGFFYTAKKIMKLARSEEFQRFQQEQKAYEETFEEQNEYQRGDVSGKRRQALQE